MSDVLEFMQKKGNAHRVAPLRTRDFRAQPFSGDTVCRSTGIHDMGAPMYEWKEELDGMGRSFPVCTTVLSSDKSKVYTDADKTALDTKIEVERQAGRTTGKEAERLRAALTYQGKMQDKRNEQSAQALTLIEATVTRDLWARFKPIIKTVRYRWISKVRMVILLSIHGERVVPEIFKKYLRGIGQGLGHQFLSMSNSKPPLKTNQLKRRSGHTEAKAIGHTHPALAVRPVRFFLL